MGKILPGSPVFQKSPHRALRMQHLKAIILLGTLTVQCMRTVCSRLSDNGAASCFHDSRAYEPNPVSKIGVAHSLLILLKIAISPSQKLFLLLC